MFVEREHFDIARVRRVQLANGRGGTVGKRYERRPDETARLTQVGEHGALVGAVFELAVQLRRAHHRAFEFAAPRS